MQKNIKVLIQFTTLTGRNMLYFFLEAFMENQINTGKQNTQQVGQNPVSQPVATPEKPKINYLMVGGVALACSLIFGFGGYYFGKQSLNSQTAVNDGQSQVLPTTTSQTNDPIPTINPSSTPDPTANWKTYTNENYSYQLKYPSGWKTIPSIIKGSKTETVGLHGAELQGKTIYLHSNYVQNPAMPFLQIETSTNETQESYDTRKQSRSNSKETLVNGYPAITAKQKSSPEPGTSFDREGYVYFWFIYNNQLNNIYDITCSEDLPNENLCNQILSTFKFAQ